MPAPTVELNGEYLKTLREKCERKQHEIESALKLGRGRLTQYESDKGRARLEEVQKLAEYYKVPAADLISPLGRTELKNWILLGQTLLNGSETKELTNGHQE